MDKGSTWATAAGFGAILLWSATVALSRSLSEQLGPLLTGALVFTCSGLLTLAFTRLRGGCRTGACAGAPFNFRYYLGCGGLFLVYTVSFYLAIGLARDRAQAVELALLNYLWPSLTILFSALLLPVKASWALLPGLCLAFGGIVVVMIPAQGAGWAFFLDHVTDNPAAYASAFTAGVTWAVYSVLTRRLAPAGGGGAPYFMILSGLALAGLAAAKGTDWGALTLRNGFEPVFLILSTAVAYAFWDIAMRRGKVTRVAAASNFTPLFSTLVSCAYLGVTPAPRVWIGSLLIAAGSLVCWRSVRESSEQ
jgi:drug/metabolite transporter (DMT)-like permease